MIKLTKEQEEKLASYKKSRDWFERSFPSKKRIIPSISSISKWMGLNRDTIIKLMYPEQANKHSEKRKEYQHTIAPEKRKAYRLIYIKKHPGVESKTSLKYYHEHKEECIRKGKERRLRKKLCQNATVEGKGE